MVLLMIVAVPAIAFCQPHNTKPTPPTTAGQKPAAVKAQPATLNDGVSTCNLTPQPTAAQVTPITGSQVTLTKLEANDRVLQVATTGIAAQLVQQHPPGSNIRVDISGSEAIFIDELAAAYLKLTSSGPADCSINDGAPKTLAAQSETSQTNKQTGAPSTSDGTTSAVEQTGIPELLTIAEENGAVTSTTSGSTTTLSTSLYGLAKGFGIIKDTAEDYSACPFCDKLGASATFNVASTSNSAATISRKEVSQWQLKYSFFDLSSRSQRAKKLWDAETLASAGAFAASLNPPPTMASASREFEALKEAIDTVITSHSAEIANQIQAINTASASNSTSGAGQATEGQGKPAATNADLANKILGYLDVDAGVQNALQTILSDQEFTGFVTNTYSLALNNYVRSDARFEADVLNLSKGVNGFNGDLTFGQQFPTSTSTSTTSSTTTTSASTSTSASAAHLPAYLVGALDLSFQPKAKPNPSGSTPPSSGGTISIAPAGLQQAMPSFTLNFKTSFYTEPNASLNEKTFRGGQGALQMQWNLGSGPFVKNVNDDSQVTVSLNGSYERLQENKDQKGKRPDIVLGSLKLAVPISSGVSFPFAVSFANASEQQAKGAYVIGNFGISFDLDKLSALLNAK
jgi:hypothetical protein